MMSVLFRQPAPGDTIDAREPVASSAFRANLFARPGAAIEPFPPPRFTMWLNHTNRIISLPSQWGQFVAAIGSPELRRDHVLGRPVAWFFQDDTARECFRVLLERVRSDVRPARILARCDAPGVPRAMQLKLAPMSAGAMECTWTYFQGDPAEGVPLDRPTRYPFQHHIRMCSWCRQVHLDDAWQSLDGAAAALGLLDHEPLPPITHGICPPCSAAVAVSSQAV